MRRLFASKFRARETGVLPKKDVRDSNWADHPDNQKLARRAASDEDGEYSLVDSNRRCTDILFLLLLVCCWVAMTGVGLAATGVVPSAHIKKGDPRRLVNGMDYLGNLCGVTNYLTPSGEDTIDLPKAYPMPSGFSVCVAECPTETNKEEFICEYDGQHEIDTLFGSSEFVDVDEEDAKKSLYLFYASRKQCMPRVDSVGFLGYCIPKVNELLLDSASDDNSTATASNETDADTPSDTESSISVSIARMASSSSSEFYDKAVADAMTVRYVIFGFGCGFALLLGILFLVVIQLPGILSLMVWLMVFAIDAGLVAAGYHSKILSTEWAANGIRTGNEARALFYASHVLYALAGLWLVTIFFLRKRIVLAVNCVREAAKAVASMPVITVFPVVQVLGLVAFTVVWGVFMAYLASSGEIVASCMCPAVDENATLSTLAETVASNDGVCEDGCLVHKELVYAQNTKYAGLYLLFSWFWTSQFIVAVGQLVVALSISRWYFSRNKKIVNNGTFFRSFGLVVFYHLGTAAFGSLIIAVVKTVRAVLTYIQKKATKSKLKVAVVILSVLKCLLWCVEKVLKFVSKQAYIQTAIFGYPFCKASKMGFFLILRNALRISAVAVVTQVVLFIAKVFITVASAVAGYYYLEIHFVDELNSLMVPTLLIGLCAYAVSEMFNEVFGMAISTILQCFVVDEELFDADERFAPGSLAGTIDSTQQKYKKKKKVMVEGEATA
ncbi:hypothetical protein ACHAXT_007344 [Thalassiosira profunda]